MQALSFAVHVPLVCFGITVPSTVLLVESLYLRTSDELHRTLANRWSKEMIAPFVVGATLTFLGERVVLAIGVIALAAFIVAGVAELLCPEVLEWGELREPTDPGPVADPDAPRAAAARRAWKLWP